MNTFKRKALSCAILGGLGAAAGAAHAVYQDPNGLGQALVYPYYSVNSTSNNALNTYVSIVNTTTTGKALKVRFREGKNSREVLDFNLFLSPNDVWTAAVVPTDATTAAGGRLITTDTSCVNPVIPAGGVDFRNYAYVGTNTDAAGTGLDRTREGYLEVIEMATVSGSILTAITHTAAGTPANCALVQSNNLSATAPAGTFTAPTGGLAGSFTLINVNNGADLGGNAVALANFRAVAAYTDTGDETSNLGTADPVAVVVSNQPTGTTVYTAGFTTGRDAVSATMMHSSVINEYVLDAATRSNTDWVLTFPTKQLYVTPAAAVTPFTNKFTATGACEPITFTFFNREEAGQQATPGDFSPSPPGATPDSLCWESTVLSIRNGGTGGVTGTTSGVLGSANITPINVRTGFQNGWARLTFAGTAATTTGIASVAAATTVRNVNTGAVAAAGTAATFRGLPVVGFMARTLFNGTLSCTNAAGAATSCQGSYGSLFDHRFEQSITPAP